MILCRRYMRYEYRESKEKQEQDKYRTG